MQVTRPGEPQFGEAQPGVAYADRPGVYALAFRRSRLLVIETSAGYFLPGGGIDPGESPDDALRRELREEAGLVIEDAVEVGSARQYVVDAESAIGYNKIERFYLVTLVDNVHDAVEADHKVHWVAIEEALARLREPAQAWAVSTVFPAT